MRHLPANESDHFAEDFFASLMVAVGMSLVGGPVVWFLALLYLQRTYPGHAELFGAAIVAGVADGLFLGAGAFVITFSVRIWIRERRERKRSDDMLRAALEEIAQNNGGR